MTRRDLLALGAASALSSFASAKTTQDKALLGGSPTTFGARARAARQNGQVFDVVEHCHQLGLAGAEAARFDASPEAVRTLRQKIDSYGMVVIVNIPLPKTDADLAQFETAVTGAKEAGVTALHAAMTQRRYEEFHTLADFQANFAQCQRIVERAEPILQKHKLPLAVENHKGWRAAEQAAWMKRVSSEWVGVCLDMGNNIALCEMPDETFAALTQYAIFSHIKDMGLDFYPDGFLLSEVVFGQGVIDLSTRVAQLRQKNPKMLFCLEMITRDPLKVPVFTESYWPTFSDAATQIPARDVAQVLNLVRLHPPKTPLPQTTGLSLEQTVEAEDGNNQACIDWARKNLNT